MRKLHYAYTCYVPSIDSPMARVQSERPWCRPDQLMYACTQDPKKVTCGNCRKVMDSVEVRSPC